MKVHIFEWHILNKRYTILIPGGSRKQAEEQFEDWCLNNPEDQPTAYSYKTTNKLTLLK